MMILLAAPVAQAQTEVETQSGAAQTSVAQNQNQFALRNYPLSGGGAFQAMIPLSWSEQIQQSANGQTNIVLRPRAGAPLEFMITPIRAPKPDVLAPSVLREGVEKSANEILPQVMEASLKIQELGGETARGYYFSATDKRPLKAGEFKYITQGILAVGFAMVPFTILHNDKTGATAELCLNILRGSAFAAN